jgi:hypothetical protein
MKKKLIVSIVVLSLLAIGVTASLLQYFGKITTTANVKQSVTLIGSETHTIPEQAPGGERFCFLHKLQDDASIDILVGFEMDCDKDGQEDNCEGIVQTIYNVPETRTLNLCAKETTTWQCNQGATAILTFDPVNPTFKGTLTTTGLVEETQYALIYYPDQVDRFDPNKWNGAGGLVIATFTGDVTDFAIDIDLNSNLPKASDWNVNPLPDYCNLNNGFDDYDHCKGAKLWIVKTEDLTDGSLPLKKWNPSAWLFETDLIVYSDCDLEPDNFVVDMQFGSSIVELLTKSRTLTPFLVCYDFDVAIEAGEYEITTMITP